MKKHILLIDDDKDEWSIFLEALKNISEQDSYKCTYASSADQALEMLQQVVPNFIFIDLNMPKINGLQLLALIKKENRLHNTSVFLYSTYVSEETKKEAMKTGAASCINKTNSIDMLTRELKSVLNTADTRKSFSAGK